MTEYLVRLQEPQINRLLQLLEQAPYGQVRDLVEACMEAGRRVQEANQQALREAVKAELAAGDKDGADDGPAG